MCSRQRDAGAGAATPIDSRNRHSMKILIALRPASLRLGTTSAIRLVALSLLLWFGTACQGPPANEPAPAAVAATESAPLVADAGAGKAFWEGPVTFCGECHGVAGEGAYGPDLAGRKLTFEQFRRQVRQPWGAMPRWSEQQLNDQTLANVHAYLSNLPRVEKPGSWKVTAPADASPALRYFTESYGCAQCHGLDMEAAVMGAEDPNMNFEWFMTRVYTHDKAFPLGKMGSFSPIRLPEEVLRVIWDTASAQAAARKKSAATASAQTARPPASGGSS
jgi:mono/diheme cytochrome c family protein